MPMPTTIIIKVRNNRFHLQVSNIKWLQAVYNSGQFEPCLPLWILTLITVKMSLRGSQLDSYPSEALWSLVQYFKCLQQIGCPEAKVYSVLSLNWNVWDVLDNGIIEPSMSAWSTPIVPVKKKDGSLRVCVDLSAIKYSDTTPNAKNRWSNWQTGRGEIYYDPRPGKGVATGKSQRQRKTDTGLYSQYLCFVSILSHDFRGQWNPCNISGWWTGSYRNESIHWCIREWPSYFRS